MKKVIIIVLAVLLIGGGVAAYIFLMPKEEKRYYYPLGDAFVTNVPESNSLIKTTMVLGISRDAAEDLLPENARLRDCILNVLRNQTQEMYASGELQNHLSGVIISELNALLPPKEDEPPLFVAVYFTDFVMQ